MNFSKLDSLQNSIPTLGSTVFLILNFGNSIFYHLESSYTYSSFCFHRIFFDFEKYKIPSQKIREEFSSSCAILELPMNISWLEEILRLIKLNH